jgi:hypothetical protein
MWFTGINYYKLAVEKNRHFIFTTIWKPDFYKQNTFLGERKACVRITPGPTHSPTSVTSVFAVYMLNICYMVDSSSWLDMLLYILTLQFF